MGGIALLRTFICDIDTTFVANGERNAFFTLAASLKGLKYYINPYTIGDVLSQKTLNYTDSCLGTSDKCRISTLWKTGLCNK